MTRKDYKIIVYTIRECITNEYDTVEQFVEKLAERLSYDNPSFDKAKFLKACYPNECKLEI